MNILGVVLFVVALIVLLQVPNMSKRGSFAFFCCLVFAVSLGYAALVLLHIAPVFPIIQTLVARR